MPPSYSFIHLFIFFSYSGLAVILLLLGKYTHPEKKITRVWIIFFLGIFSGAIYHLADIGLFAVGAALYVQLVTGSLSGALVVIAMFLLKNDSIMNLELLRRRQEELKTMMEKIKNMYLRREISEKEMTDLRKDIIKGLVEVEVKMEKKEEMRSFLEGL